MRKLDNPLQRFGIQLLLFMAGLLIFSWPLIAHAVPWSLHYLISFLFIGWGAFVLLLFLMGLSGNDNRSDGGSPGSRD